jgi:ketosteroid isomerase-like protein
MKRRSMAATLALLVLLAVPLGAQRKADPPMRLTEEQAVDLAISEMLAAWQIGDLETLRGYHADDLTVVSGGFEPPIVGWANYAQAYARQRQRVIQPRIERRNTLVHVKGTIAWASYQWEFGALVEGKPSVARGHTTLVLEKRRDRWIVLHNHTSVVTDASPAQPSQR